MRNLQLLLLTIRVSAFNPRYDKIYDIWNDTVATLEAALDTAESI